MSSSNSPDKWQAKIARPRGPPPPSKLPSFMQPLPGEESGSSSGNGSDSDVEDIESDDSQYDSKLL